MLRRRYIIWIGLCAIIAPLLVNLYTQYASLTELQRTSPLARQASWEHRLENVATDVQQYYRERAFTALAVPPQVIVRDGADDAVEVCFRDAPAEGVKRYFLSSPFTSRPNADPSRPSMVKVTMYDPLTRTKVAERTPDHWAAFSASAAFFSLILRDASVDPNKLVFGEDDPDNRIIAKPITDSSSRAVGVAGMIVDADYFRDVILPRTLPDALRKHFSEAELEEMAFSVLDDNGRLVTGTHASSESTADVWVPLDLSFSKWRLGAKSHGLTQQEVASRNFAMNFTLTLLNTVALMIGLALTLRAAGKEMKISQMKSDFVSNVSHELRTPLASIRVLGEFLRSGREVEPEKLRKYGEYIETESQRLAKLINNILDFSKIESGQRNYDFSEQQIEFVIAEVLRVFEVRLVQRGFSVDLDVPEDLLPPVLIDPDAVTQALSNLIDNAVKYSGSSREIRIRAWHENSSVFVAVTDFGIGIPRDDQEKIFDRFHRVSTGLVHNVKGSGLGLSLVKHIVEAHDGAVTVSSEAGRGSTFTVKFPIHSRVAASKSRRGEIFDENLQFELGNRPEPTGSDV
jgi:signal transduction histidine kinase